MTCCVFTTRADDPRLIAFAYADDHAEPTQGFAIMPSTGGAPNKRLPGASDRIHWSADGKSLLFLKSSAGLVPNIWRQPLSGGEAVPITSLQPPGVTFFDLSPDGARLLYLQQKSIRDAVLIREIK